MGAPGFSSADKYKDCTRQDFNHYFRGTYMVYRLRPGSDKYRLFQVEGIGNDSHAIEGSYLSLGEEWKDKAVPFERWWEHLFCVSSFAPRRFNLQKGCASWYPELATNRRKSLFGETATIEVLGDVSGPERIEQHFLQKAFPELYTPSHKIMFPTADEFLRSSRVAAHVQGGFTLVNQGDMLYGRKKIGAVKDSMLYVYPQFNFFSKLLVEDSGAKASSIVVKELEDKITTPKKGPKHPWGPLHPNALGHNSAGWRVGVYFYQYATSYIDTIAMIMPRWGTGYIIRDSHGHYRLRHGEASSAEDLPPGVLIIDTWALGGDMSETQVSSAIGSYTGD